MQRPGRHALLGGLLAVCFQAGTAGANGRFPATVSVKFQPGDPDRMLLSATFGVLLSTDGGETFQWVCEQAVGYTGTYDPDYELASDGTIYSTSFEGLRRSIDGGCSWTSIEDPDVDRTTFINQVEIGPDDRIWAATSQGGAPNDVFVSSDGVEFESTGLLSENWWLTVVTTPADSGRVYASGYQYPISTGEDPRPAAPLLRRKQGDGPWQVLPTEDFNFVPEMDECDEDPLPAACRVNPFIYLLGVSPTDENLVFARAVGVNPPTGDDLYRSTDGGDSWEKVLDMADTIGAFVIRADGTIIVGTSRACPGETADDKGCVRISTEDGAAGSWQTPATEPRMVCLGERDDGVLFACVPHAQPDLRVLIRSTDAQSWETVLRFRELAEADHGPLACPADTVQATTCVQEAWRPLICGDLLLDVPMCAGAPDAGGTGGDDVPDGSGGCCRVGRGGPGAATPVFLAFLWLMTRARRHSRRIS
jgi:hypothetical protein